MAKTSLRKSDRVPSSNPGMSPRMSDVAALAGVATMTVSRVLNGYALVSEKTRRRVHRAAQILNYQPDHLASALRGSRSHTIGVLLPSLSDSRCSMLLQGINERAFASDYSVILGTTGDRPESEQEEAVKMARRRVDGVIVIATRAKVKPGAPDLSGLRVVHLDARSTVSSPDSVAVEHRQGCYLAVQHLQQHGHRRILFLGHSPRLHIPQQRLAGYRQAMEEGGGSMEACLQCSSVESVAAALKARCGSADRATAVIAADQTIARYVFQALKGLDLGAPDDVALIGCDDFEMADALQPSLTVVSQPVYQMGQEAAGLLISRLEGRAGDAVTHMTLPCRLVLRNSCGCRGAGFSRADPRLQGDVALPVPMVATGEFECAVS